MIHHYLTKYRENGKQIVESWIQLNILRWHITLSDRKMVIKKPSEDGR